MKEIVFNLIAQAPYLFIRALDSIFHTLSPRSPRSVLAYVYNKATTNQTIVNHNNCFMKFFTPTAVTLMRAVTFSNKEPETLSWIEKFENDAVFIDVGANVGVYSIYACKKHSNLRCVAIEPSATNFEILVRNIMANECGQRIIPACVALSSQTSVNTFSLSSLEAGEALNAFGVDYGFDGKSIDTTFTHQTIGFALSDLINIFAMGKPNYIKIDVDGIEHLILEGARNLLMDPALKSILVEINDDFEEQRKKCTEILEGCGFRLTLKTHAPMFDSSERYGRTHNHIWAR